MTAAISDSDSNSDRDSSPGVPHPGAVRAIQVCLHILLSDFAVTRTFLHADKTYVLQSPMDCTEVEYATKMYSELHDTKGVPTCCQEVSPATKKRLYDELQREVKAVSPTGSSESSMSDWEYCVWQWKGTTSDHR